MVGKYLPSYLDDWPRSDIINGSTLIRLIDYSIQIQPGWIISPYEFVLQFLTPNKYIHSTNQI